MKLLKRISALMFFRIYTFNFCAFFRSIPVLLDVQTFPNKLNILGTMAAQQLEYNIKKNTSSIKGERKQNKHANEKLN